MNLPYKIARRYLFAKKSANAINIISGISVGGIAIGTAALILILSVFNGFEDLITSLFGTFNPDIKVTARVGKTFELDSTTVRRMERVPGVEAVSATLEEIAFFEYENVQDFGLLKGVDEHFPEVVDIEASIVEGRFQVQDGERAMAVLGSALRNKLAVNVLDPFESMRVYLPKRRNVGPLGKAYNSRLLAPAGTFFIQQDYDNEYVITSLPFVQGLLEQRGEISAFELGVVEGFSVAEVKEGLREVLGEDFEIRDRYEQDEAFMKVMNMEKWMAFAILGFTMILVAFNMIGALWMVVIDKKRDIAILRSMGATRRTIRNIFLWEGLLLCGLGLLLGFAIAFLFFGAQKFFGIVPIPAGFIIDAYPISLRGGDFVAVLLLVTAIGLLASLPAAMRATRVPAIVRAE